MAAAIRCKFAGFTRQIVDSNLFRAYIVKTPVPRVSFHLSAHFNGKLFNFRQFLNFLTDLCDSRSDSHFFHTNVISRVNYFRSPIENTYFYRFDAL